MKKIFNKNKRKESINNVGFINNMLKIKKQIDSKKRILIILKMKIYNQIK